MKTENPFERGVRYLVVKLNDIRTASMCGTLTDEQRRSLEDIVGIIGTRQCVVVEKDWPEYELFWALIEARVASEGSFDAQAKIKKAYYEVLSVLHGLAGRTEKPASSESPEIVKHWYLVCWKSVNGLEGNTEIWFDRPWRKGDLVLAIRLIEGLNTKEKTGNTRDAIGVNITSVIPIDG